MGAVVNRLNHAMDNLSNVVLNTTEGTIAWRMHEARNQLRRALGVPSVVSSKSMERIASPAPGEADPNSYTLAFALASVLSV